MKRKVHVLATAAGIALISAAAFGSTPALSADRHGGSDRDGIQFGASAEVTLSGSASYESESQGPPAAKSDRRSYKTRVNHSHGHSSKHFRPPGYHRHVPHTPHYHKATKYYKAKAHARRYRHDVRPVRFVFPGHKHWRR